MDNKCFVIDTNAILDHIHSLKKYKKVLLTHVLREIEKHKVSKNYELAFRAREVSRYIRENQNEFIFDGRTYDGSEIGDRLYEDNNIIKACLENEYGLITGDALLIFQAKAYDIEVIDID